MGRRRGHVQERCWQAQHRSRVAETAVVVTCRLCTKTWCYKMEAREALVLSSTGSDWARTGLLGYHCPAEKRSCTSFSLAFTGVCLLPSCLCPFHSPSTIPSQQPVHNLGRYSHSISAFCLTTTSSQFLPFVLLPQEEA